MTFPLHFFHCHPSSTPTPLHPYISFHSLSTTRPFSSLLLLFVGMISATLEFQSKWRIRQLLCLCFYSTSTAEELNGKNRKSVVCKGTHEETQRKGQEKTGKIQEKINERRSVLHLQPVWFE